MADSDIRQRWQQWLFEGHRPTPWRFAAVAIAAITVPSAVTIAVFGSAALESLGMAALLSAMPAYFAACHAGLAVSAVVTIVTGMAGILSLGNPAMSLLVGPTLAVLAAICGHHGLARPALQAMLAWTIFTSPLLQPSQPVLILAVYLAAMVWSLGVTKVFHHTFTTGIEKPQSKEYATIFGILLAFGMVLSMGIGNRYFGSHGYWFPLTLVVFALPPHAQLLDRSVKRVIGTLVAVLLVIAISTLVEFPPFHAALAVLSQILAVRIMPVSYVGATLLLTIGILETVALSTDIEIAAIAFERLGTVAAAALLAGILMGIGVLAFRVATPAVQRSRRQD